MARFDEHLQRFFYDPDEAVGPFLELAPEVDLNVRAAETEVPEEFLAFRLSNEIYAVPVGLVREVMKVPVVTPVPRVGSSVLGVMNVRGEMLPLYDIKSKLKLSSRPTQRTVDGKPQERLHRVVLLRDDQGDAGVLTDAVLGVVKLQLSRLEPPPGLGVDTGAIAGLGRLDGELYILLDVEQVLA